MTIGGRCPPLQTLVRMSSVRMNVVDSVVDYQLSLYIAVLKVVGTSIVE